METNTQNQNSANNATSNTGNANNAGSNGDSSNKLNDLMGMAAPYLSMLTDQAGRVPEMLKSAGTTVTNGYKSMSTTTKVVTASALAVGVGLLVTNMRKGKKAGENGQSKKSGKNRS